MTKIINNVYTIKLFNENSYIIFFLTYYNNIVSSEEKSRFDSIIKTNVFKNKFIRRKTKNYVILWSKNPINITDDTNLVDITKDKIKEFKRHFDKRERVFVFNMNDEETTANIKSKYWFSIKKDIINNVIDLYYNKYFFEVKITRNDGVEHIKCIFFGKKLNLLETYFTQMKIKYNTISFHDNVEKYVYVSIDASDINYTTIMSKFRYIQCRINNLTRLKIENNFRTYIENIDGNYDWMDSPIIELDYLSLHKVCNIKVDPFNETHNNFTIYYFNNIYYELLTKALFSYNNLTIQEVITSNKSVIIINYLLDIRLCNNILKTLHLWYYPDNIPCSNHNIKLKYYGEKKTILYDQDVSVEPPEYEFYGFNLKGIRLKCEYLQNCFWLKLLNNNFYYDIDNSIWIKNITTIDDSNMLKYMGINESAKSIESKTNLQCEFDQFIIPDTYYSNNILIRISRFYNDINNLDLENLEIYINLDTTTNSVYKSNIYYNINFIYLAYFTYDNNILVSNVVKLSYEQLEDMKIKFIDILKNNIIISHDTKNILTLLLYNNIITRDDVNHIVFEDTMIAAWIYNPVRYTINMQSKDYNKDLIDSDHMTYYSDLKQETLCEKYIGFGIDDIYTSLICKVLSVITSGDITKTDNKHVLYLGKVYLIYKFLYPMIVNLNLESSYIREINASNVFSKIESWGMKIDLENAKNLQNVLLKRKLKRITYNITYLLKRIFNDNKSKVLVNSIIDKISDLSVRTTVISNLVNKLLFKSVNTVPPTLFMENLVFPEANYRTVNSNYTITGFYLSLYNANVNNKNVSDPVKLNNLLKLLKFLKQFSTYKWVYHTYLPNLISNTIPPNTIDNNENNVNRGCIKVWGSNRGRISTLFPNIHFTPNTKKTKLGKAIRRLFISREGYSFIISDWSAQELGSVGYLTGDPEFISSYNEQDLHLDTALSIFNNETLILTGILDDIISFDLVSNDIFESSEKIYILITYIETSENGEAGEKIHSLSKNTLNESGNDTINFKMSESLKNQVPYMNKPNYKIRYIKEQQRTIAKYFNFGAMYGKSLESYSEDLQIPVSEVSSYLEKWETKWSTIVDFMNYCKKTSLDTGMAYTLKNNTGRRIFYPETLSSNKFIRNKALNNSINYINSGTCADLLKSVLIEIDDIIQNEYGYNNNIVNIVHTMHDEVIVEVKDEYIDRVKVQIKKIMEHPNLFEYDKPQDFSFKIDMDICKWWDSCNGLDDNTWEYNED